jgi:hypothetical protein
MGTEVDVKDLLADVEFGPLPGPRVLQRRGALSAFCQAVIERCLATKTAAFFPADKLPLTTANRTTHAFKNFERRHRDVMRGHRVHTRSREGGVYVWTTKP